MIFNTMEECVFLKFENGSFKNDDGQEINWNKLTFANPTTFENHELGCRPDLNFNGLKKGQRILLELELEATSKKSRVFVSSYQLIK